MAFLLHGMDFLLNGTDNFLVHGDIPDLTPIAPGAGVGQEGSGAITPAVAIYTTFRRTMASTILTPFLISTPGRKAFGWGVEYLNSNGDVLKGFVNGVTPIDNDAVTLDCDIDGVTFDAVSTNSTDIEIGGVTFEPGTVILFTIEAEADIEPDADKTYAEGLVTASIKSTGGYEEETDKPIRVGTIRAR